MYLSRVVLSVMVTARIVWVVNIVGSLIALVPVLQVKDTGKSSKRVNPIKLLPRENKPKLNKHNPPLFVQISKFVK